MIRSVTAPNSTGRLALEIAAHVESCESRSVPRLRIVRRAASKILRGETPQRARRVILHLLADARVPRWFAYELVNQDDRVLGTLTEFDLERMGHGMATWGDVDSFGCLVSGPAWREQRISTDQVMVWAQSPDRWWRRAALVSTVPLNNTARGGTGDPVRTLAICRQLAHDRDDMVVKAMSWALRELAKKDPAKVEIFLAQHEADLAPRVLREVRNKLKTGLKNPKPR